MFGCWVLGGIKPHASSSEPMGWGPRTETQTLPVQPCLSPPKPELAQAAGNRPPALGDGEHLSPRGRAHFKVGTAARSPCDGVPDQGCTPLPTGAHSPPLRSVRPPPPGLCTWTSALPEAAEPGKGRAGLGSGLWVREPISLLLLPISPSPGRGPGVSPEPRIRDKIKSVSLVMSAWFLTPRPPDSGRSFLPPPLPSPLACQLIIRFSLTPPAAPNR